MTLWLIAGTMTALVVGLQLWPLLRLTGAPESRRGFDMAVYRDQLSEVERDLGRGVLTDEQAGAARHEIERRLLSAAETAPPGEMAAPTAKTRWTPAIAAVLAVALPAGALPQDFQRRGSRQRATHAGLSLVAAQAAVARGRSGRALAFAGARRDSGWPALRVVS